MRDGVVRSVVVVRIEGQVRLYAPLEDADVDANEDALESENNGAAEGRPIPWSLRLAGGGIAGSW